MNENSLYGQTLKARRSRSGIWIGTAIMIAAGSLYLICAGEKDSPAPNSANAISTTNNSTQSKAMSDTELRKKLTPDQYHVTRENGTEPPFHNQYWDNHRPGIYVDVISGEPLFASSDKFESGTGWPSF